MSPKTAVLHASLFVPLVLGHKLLAAEEEIPLQFSESVEEDEIEENYRDGKISSEEAEELKDLFYNALPDHGEFYLDFASKPAFEEKQSSDYSGRTRIKTELRKEALIV